MTDIENVSATRGGTIYRSSSSVDETHLIASTEADHPIESASSATTPQFIQWLMSEFRVSEVTAYRTLNADIDSVDMIMMATEADLRELGWTTGSLIRYRRWNAAMDPTDAAVSTPTQAPQQAAPARMLTIPKGLPSYDADSAKWSPQQFLEEFNLLCNAVNFPEDKRPTIFVTQLTGSARQWGKLAIINGHLDWLNAQAAFLGRFTRTQDTHYLREKLFTIRQYSDERVLAYSTRLQELVVRLGENIDSANVLFLFKQGLLPKFQERYMTATTVHEPATFEEAV